jgi:hypothetical protein
MPSDCDHVTQYLNDSSRFQRNHTCAPCPLGASCLGPIGWSKVKAKNGWWRLHDKSHVPPSCLNQKFNDNEARYNGGSTSEPPCAFTECLNPIACQGKITKIMILGSTCVSQT